MRRPTAPPRPGAPPPRRRPPRVQANTHSSPCTQTVDTRLTVSVDEPTFSIRVAYDASAGLLAGADAVRMRFGHSGWQNPTDVPLERDADDPNVWRGVVSVPASRLPSAGHAQLQAAFVGRFGAAEERWDNAGGGDYAFGCDVVRGRGVVAAARRRDGALAAARLLVRLDALAAARALPAEAVTLLRTMAWAQDPGLLAAFAAAATSDDASLAAALGARCGVAPRPGLHIVHVASEAAPFAKVGGLADVVSGLGRAHFAGGHLVELILPKYDAGDYSSLTDLRVLGQFSVPWRGGPPVPVAVWAAVCAGLPCYLIEPQAGPRAFWRGKIYGEPDDVSRFLFFAAAAVEFLAWSGRAASVDVVHAHDWQAAAVPLLARLADAAAAPPAAPPFARAAMLLTIHNLEFQGRTAFSTLADVAQLAPATLPPWAAAALTDPRPGPHAARDANLLKAAIDVADATTTVSPPYAADVVTPAHGNGLDGALRGAAARGAFCGIVNGIDVESYDPATDAALPARLPARGGGAGSQPPDAAAVAAWKRACKAALAAELGLDLGRDDESSRPPFLLAVVSRLTQQKGVDMMLAGVDAALAAGAAVVVVGTAPDPAVDARFRGAAAAAAAAPHGGRARFCFAFNEGLARRVYAASDGVLMPSVFEPCGLSQLLALRYGSIPVARRTGGLAATLADVADAAAPLHTRNAFLFDDPTPAAAVAAVRRALDAHANAPDWWAGELVPRAAGQDWSWARSAADYAALYRSALARRR